MDCENYRLCKEGAHPALLLTILKHDNISIPDVLVLLATTILVPNSKGTNKTCTRSDLCSEGAFKILFLCPPIILSAACSKWLFSTCIVLALEPTQQTLSGKKLGGVLSWLTQSWRPLAWLRDPPNDRVTKPPSVEDKLIRNHCLSAGNEKGNKTI